MPQLKTQIEIKEKGLLQLVSMVRESEIILLKLIVIHFKKLDTLTHDRFMELMAIAHKRMIEDRK